MTSDTWELDVSTAGNDRSCNVLWEGLISQNYFDVEAVLLGGAVGSTNTAMTLGIFLLALILVTLVVLVRRANQQDDEGLENDFEDDFDDDFEYESEQEIIDENDINEAISTEKKGIEPLTPGVLTDELRSSLAQQATEVGVMQAAPGTEQGSTGWYVDVSSEVQYWNVGADGSWTRGE